MSRVRVPGVKKRKATMEPGWESLAGGKQMDTEAFLRDRCEMVIEKKREVFKEEDSPHVTASHLAKFITREVKMPNGIRSGYWYDHVACLWSEAIDSVLSTHAQAILESVCKERELPFPWQKEAAMRNIWKHVAVELMRTSKDFVVNTAYPNLCPVDYVYPDGTVVPAVIDVESAEVSPRTREHYFSATYAVSITEDHLAAAEAYACNPDEKTMKILFPNVHRFYWAFFCGDYSQVCVVGWVVEWITSA